VGLLIYSMLVSVDGYVSRSDRSFDWADPDDETLAFITERMHGVGTYLYGRRYYETMTNWANLRTVPGLKPLDYEFSDLWNATPKWVYTKTLAAASTDKTTLIRDFNPEAIRELKASSDKHVTVEGTQIAELCFDAELIDGVSIYQVPISTGGGVPFMPADAQIDLDLKDVHRFASGIVNLRYDVRY